MMIDLTNNRQSPVKYLLKHSADISNKQKKSNKNTVDITRRKNYVSYN